jgi:hypothetical protein
VKPAAESAELADKALPVVVSPVEGIAMPQHTVSTGQAGCVIYL